MVDHARLDALTDLVERSSAKLIAVGDGKQLPSIGPGGMFDRLTGHAPTAELADIHRTSDAGEQKAWESPTRRRTRARDGALPLPWTAAPRGHPRPSSRERRPSMGSAHPRTRRHPLGALIADASNQEIDRLNARAQHLRAERGELGNHEITLPNVHYGLRDDDLIAFTAQHQPHGQPRIENGTRGRVSHVHEHGVTITLDGSGRRVQLASEHLDSLRLAYAQHVYRQQGATVENPHRPHRRLANQQRDRLRPGHARPPRHRLVHRPRPTRQRRTRRRPNQTTRPEHEPQPQTNTITRLPRGHRPRLATQPKPPTTATHTAARPLAHPTVRPRRARPQHWTRTVKGRLTISVWDQPSPRPGMSASPLCAASSHSHRSSADTSRSKQALGAIRREGCGTRAPRLRSCAA